MAPTFTAIFIPSLVPLVIAESKLVPVTSELISVFLATSSVCGNISLEITIAPGAAITDAIIKFFATSIL